MATIDLTTEPDAGQLARQVLGAETLAEARAFAQAVVDAEDEPRSPLPLRESLPQPQSRSLATGRRARRGRGRRLR